MNKIAKGFQKIDIKKLVMADWNYKEEEEDKLIKLVNNIKKNGQVENIIIRELEDGNCEVVNGNHRLEAFRTIGFEEVFVYNLGDDIDDQQAKRIAIETNETKFETNPIKLAEIIKELEGTYGIEELVTTMPYNENALENMLKNLEDFTFGDDEFLEKVKVSETGESGIMPVSKIFDVIGFVEIDSSIGGQLINKFKTMITENELNDSEEFFQHLINVIE